MLSIATGLGLLFLGAEGLVRGSSGLSLRFGMPPILVGLTVVAFGTSAPELTVSILAGITHHGDVAAGNVIGSNIFNIAFILGLSALIRPLRIHLSLIRRDIPILIVAALTILPIILLGRTTRTAGLFLVGAIIAYTIATVFWCRQDSPDACEMTFTSAPLPYRHWAADVVLLAGGLLLLILGSNQLVSGAIALARYLGLSEAAISLTIVAAGTSLPELATSLVAALKKESDLAVGNIVGSNIFNSFGILGATALVSPIETSGIRLADGLLMIGLSLLLLPLAITGKVLTRWEGAVFLALYVTYLYWLWPTP